MHTQSGEYHEDNTCNKIRKWGVTHDSVIRGIESLGRSQLVKGSGQSPPGRENNMNWAG